MARRGSKKFTTWDFKHENVTIEVPVRMVDNADRSYSDGKTYFQVLMDEPEISEQDSDINRLRETVFAKLKESLKIEWTSMLHVMVTRSRGRLFDKKKRAGTPETRQGGDGQLTLNWSRVQIAEFNGKKMHRSFNNYYESSSFGGKEPAREVWNGSRDGWPEVGKEAERNYSSDPQMRALIPDTPENRIALEAIADQIEKLYVGLERLLSGNRIEETLAGIAAGGLLKLEHHKTAKPEGAPSM